MMSVPGPLIGGFVLPGLFDTVTVVNDVLVTAIVPDPAASTTSRCRTVLAVSMNARVGSP